MKICAPTAVGAESWQEFVLSHGRLARDHELAAIVNRSVEEIRALKETGALAKLSKRKSFSELFSLWRGRPPVDEDWPTPAKLGKRDVYVWQVPELALLVSLVGRIGLHEICQILTERLRKKTGDPSAHRSKAAVQLAINRVGLQLSQDVVGGITVAEAGRESGSRVMIQDAIRNKRIRTSRVGRTLVIPHEEWEKWKSQRSEAPEGYVRLSTLRDQLAIRSDKLSEFARMGYIPTAVRCKPFGVPGPSTIFGTWFIDAKVAEQLLADRRAGKPMPWHGKPLWDNLRVTYKLWKQRQHPACCETCKSIWGKDGAPQSLEDYVKLYPPLAHDAKRHLTRTWTAGLTIEEVAAQAGCDVTLVRQAIKNGTLFSSRLGRTLYVTKTDATRWIARRCPSGNADKSWLALETAAKRYLFTIDELNQFIAEKRLLSKVGTDGAMKGIIYVGKHQCAQLREKIGFSEEQAAVRVGVSVVELRGLLDGVKWRNATGIPLETVQAAIKRLNSQQGYTVEEAAATLGVTPEWVHSRMEDGTIKVVSAKWNRERIYISAPMLERLRRAAAEPEKDQQIIFSAEWLRLSEAANEAGVTPATLIKWATSGELDRTPSSIGWRYHRDAVRIRARLYWQTARFHRQTLPGWLSEEVSGENPDSTKPANHNRL